MWKRRFIPGISSGGTERLIQENKNIMISSEQQELLYFLRASFFAQMDLDMDCGNWNAVMEEAALQAVAGFVFPVLPPEQKIKWYSQDSLQKTSFIRILHEQENLWDMFQAADIPIVILKGTSAAQYYPEPYRRSMGDVGFLVPHRLYEKAKELMVSNGYSYEYGDNEKSRHIGFRKNGVLFELHRSFSSFDRDIEPFVLEGFDRREIHSICGKEFPTFPDPINGIVFLEHIRQHMFEEGVGLRHIIDWMMFVHAYLTPEKWENEFKPLADLAGFTCFSKVLTLMCKMYIGLPDPVPWCENADPSAASELMEFVLNSGNFGHKAQKAAEQRQVEVVSRNIRRKGLFRYLQEIGELRWSLLEKHPHLRPFAWMYQSGRILKAGLKSDLKIGDIGNNLTSGDKKGQLIKKLELE